MTDRLFASPETLTAAAMLDQIAGDGQSNSILEVLGMRFATEEPIALDLQDKRHGKRTESSRFEEVKHECKGSE